MKAIRLNSLYGTSPVESKINISFPNHMIRLEYSCNNDVIIKEHEFPFMALQEIRTELEQKDIKIACKGALVNVYPSGMSAIGFLAYKLEMGKRTGKEDLVNIFDPTIEYNNLLSVDRQIKYWKDWLASLKK